MEFNLNPRFAAEVMNTQGVYDMLKEVGKTLEDAAYLKAIRSSTTIADGITHEVGFENGRIICRIVAKDFKSHWFEFGTVKMSARPFLQPAAIEAGFVLTGAAS